MMETIEAIKTRRSIRSYLEKNIDQNQIMSLLECAMYAPSAHNQQSWQFVIIDDKGLLQTISWFHQWIAMAKEAPVGILICGDLSKDVAGWFWIQDCSAATQNLLLAAHDSGLGAVWTGVYPQKEIMEQFSSLFDLPEHIVPFAFVPVGYPATPGKAGNRFKQEKVHINKR